MQNINKNLAPFEEKVLSGLLACAGAEDQKNLESLEKILSGNESKIGAAVSGGADSVSLLVSLSKILEKIGKKELLEVITVNHGIREKNQTDGDALFVENLCRKFGISCSVAVFAQGKVLQSAEKRGKGIEEAARQMRYNAFYDFISKKHLAFLCLAHNQNDQTETVLMRLLKGSGSEGMAGIPKVRGKIIRPLLDISRAEIENYLAENKISWRTDSTNFENKYSRNKIRNILVPFLNENFSGWKDSILVSGQKFFDDNLFLQKCAENEARKIMKSGGGKIILAWEKFCALDFALQRRIIYLALNKVGFGERFPFRHIKEICAWKNGVAEKKCVLTFEKLKIMLKNPNLEIELLENLPSEKKWISYGYNFVFKDENDSFEYEKTKFYLEKQTGDENKIFLCVESCGRKCRHEARLPFFVGSFQPGEKVRACDGKLKNISDVFSDWKIPEASRPSVPVMRIFSGKSVGIEAVAIFGFVLNSKNWLSCE